MFKNNLERRHLIIHHIKVSSDVFDVLLTKVSEIQLPENDCRVGDKKLTFTLDYIPIGVYYCVMNNKELIRWCG